MERLQKVIAASGVASRRKAEELIKNKQVLVNGVIINKLGTKVDAKAEIVVAGIPIKREAKVYYLFYKPKGVISSTNDEKGRSTIMDYLPVTERLYPVGRLDYDTTGLMLVTNDGEFANYIMHPRYGITKTYIAKVTGIITYKELLKLKTGIMLDHSKSRAVRVKIKQQDKVKKTSIIEMVIQEGKKHQVKRMLAEIGFPVLKLKREKIAFLNLKGLQPGAYRVLTKKELKELYKLKQKD